MQELLMRRDDFTPGTMADTLMARRPPKDFEEASYMASSLADLLAFIEFSAEAKSSDHSDSAHYTLVLSGLCQVMTAAHFMARGLNTWIWDQELPLKRGVRLAKDLASAENA